MEGGNLWDQIGLEGIFGHKKGKFSRQILSPWGIPRGGPNFGSHGWIRLGKGLVGIFKTLTLKVPREVGKRKV